MEVFSWQPEERQLGIGPGPASYLEVHENANPGWVATLNGRSLRAVRLDGWQQGFIVPAGEGGIVTLKFTPATVYHIALALSALVVIALIIMATRRNRRRLHGQRAARSPAGPAGNPRGWPAGSGGWPAQARAWPGRTWKRFRPWTPFGRTATRYGGRGAQFAGAGGWLVLLALSALFFVIGGPVALAVPAIAVLSRWPRHSRTILAFAAMLAAGLVAAATAKPATLGYGAFSGLAQAGALIALACALTPQISGKPGWRMPDGTKSGRSKDDGQPGGTKSGRLITGTPGERAGGDSP